MRLLACSTELEAALEAIVAALRASVCCIRRGAGQFGCGFTVLDRFCRFGFWLARKFPVIIMQCLHLLMYNKYLLSLLTAAFAYSR